MARETWLIKAGLEEAMEKLVTAVEGVDKAELMEVNKVCTEIIKHLMYGGLIMTN